MPTEGPNVDAIQSYVAGLITELTAAWYLAYAIDDEMFTPVRAELIAEFLCPKPMLKNLSLRMD